MNLHKVIHPNHGEGKIFHRESLHAKTACVVFKGHEVKKVHTRLLTKFSDLSAKEQNRRTQRQYYETHREEWNAYQRNWKRQNR